MHMSQLSDFLDGRAPVWINSGYRCSHAFRVHGDGQTAMRSLCRTAKLEPDPLIARQLPRCSRCHEIAAKNKPRPIEPSGV